MKGYSVQIRYNSILQNFSRIKKILGAIWVFNGNKTSKLQLCYISYTAIQVVGLVSYLQINSSHFFELLIGKNTLITQLSCLLCCLFFYLGPFYIVNSIYYLGSLFIWLVICQWIIIWFNYFSDLLNEKIFNT